MTCCVVLCGVAWCCVAWCGVVWCGAELWDHPLRNLGLKMARAEMSPNGMASLEYMR